jgi:hypothetical protein
MLTFYHDFSGVGMVAGPQRVALLDQYEEKSETLHTPLFNGKTNTSY